VACFDVAISLTPLILQFRQKDITTLFHSSGLYVNSFLICNGKGFATVRHSVLVSCTINIECYLCHPGWHIIQSNRDNNEIDLLVYFIIENRTVVGTCKSVNASLLAS